MTGVFCAASALTFGLKLERLLYRTLLSQSQMAVFELPFVSPSVHHSSSTSFLSGRALITDKQRLWGVFHVTL